MRFASLAVLGALAAAPAYAGDTNFASLAGSQTNLQIVESDNTLTLTDTHGGGDFVVSNNLTGLFSFSAGLVDQGVNATSTNTGDALNLGCATPVQAVSFQFGIQDIFGLAGNDSITLTDNNGVSKTFNALNDGLFLQNPEGWANFVDAAGFSSVTITAANPYVVGDIATPEPMSVGLLGGGLVALAATRRRRK